ncbi:MAG TPA: hypothetical protein VLX56_04035 [Nitrososphaerales archaeon]|nr:hypothetical protein [Nitrososphaerales archaeon]
MENSEGDGPKGTISGGHPRRDAGPSTLAQAFRLPTPIAAVDGVLVLPLSKLLRILIPPLLISSLPRRAIGFSFPRGREGLALGVVLLSSTAVVSSMFDGAFGIYAALAMIWLMGGTGVAILFNSAGRGVAFVKEMCTTCRLRPIIEEHEMMHLNGEASETEVWRETRKRYSYDGLGLASDPAIHSFCPIAKRLKDSA